MDAAGHSNRTLAKQVRERIGPGVRGVSDGGIRALIDGRVRNPRRDIVSAAADVLGVSTDYLLGETDDPTPAAAAARKVVAKAAAAPLQDTDVGAVLVEAVIRELGTAAPMRWPTADFSGGAPVWAPALLEVWRRRFLEAQALAPDRPRTLQATEAAEDVARAVVAPLRALGVGTIAPVPNDRFEEYILAMVPALAIAVTRPPPRRSGTPEEFRDRQRAYRTLHPPPKKRRGKRT